tara:strand:+ start:10926 stop:11810 length:885 start_codon:yes stop_codon:yes gene_type:complete
MSVVLQKTIESIGKVSTTAAIPWDDTKPQSSEGLEVFSVAFTPQSASSDIYIDVRCSMRVSGTLALFVDGDTDAIAAANNLSKSTRVTSGRLLYRVASGSTTARTYKVRGGPDSGTLYNYDAIADDLGGVAAMGSIIITEVGAGTAVNAVQQVQRAQSGRVTTTSTIPRDDTIPQSTEGAEAITLALTPQHATSNLIFELDTGFVNTTTTTLVTVAVFVDSEPDAIAAGVVLCLGNFLQRNGFAFSIPAVSTTARTYKVRVGSSGGTFTNFYTVSDDSGGALEFTTMKITEVAQ